MDKYSTFFAGECEVILSKIIETLYADLDALNYIPLAPAEGAGLEKLKWRSFTAVGIAKIISDYAHDIPSVETYGTEQSADIYIGATSYNYDKFTVEKAQRAGRNLVDTKSAAARRALEELVDRIAWFGDEQYNIPGFINYPGITEYILPDNEGHTSKAWADKTPDEILDDINGLIDTVTETTLNKEKPNTIIMPPKLYRLISTTWVNNDHDVSILDVAKRANPDITTWGAVSALTSAGANGSGRIMAYTNSSDKLEFHLPVAIEQEQPERNGLMYSVILTNQIGGTTVYYPQSVAFADGALAAE